jgi:hypothetical protein
MRLKKLVEEADEAVRAAAAAEQLRTELARTPRQGSR